VDGNIGVLDTSTGAVHSPLDWPEDEWDKLIKTNLTGLWLVAKHVCRRMHEAKLKGSVINISSIAGLNHGHLPGSIGYASSKSAVHSATKVVLSCSSSENISFAPTFIVKPV
jgi:NAD(P)-dependent dehydrogenase (short-subunit alcohol dehydrogenase family)